MLNQKLPEKGDIIAGKYQVDGMLGSGGMGAVYQVTHRVTGKAFAIKWLLPKLSAETDAVQRFIREAQVAGRVDHPNIVEVYDVGQEGDSFYMVMELLHGESLAQRLAARGRLRAGELCKLLIPVTRGLEAAHRAGVIHRDLKPDNIYLCSEEDSKDMPKLLDFGISKMSELAGDVRSGITRQGAIMGTPFYMAPEQMRGQAVDARTDVYALGVIMYQALSGQLPFNGETLADLMLKIVSTDAKPLATLAPDVPDALVAIVTRALSRDPAARIASAAELGELLAPFASGALQGRASQRPTSMRPAAASTTTTPLATESSFGAPQPPLPARRPSRAPLVISATLVTVVAGAVLLVRNPLSAPAGPAAQHLPEEEQLVRPLQLPAAVKPSEPPQDPSALSAPSGAEELPNPNTKQVFPVDAGVPKPTPERAAEADQKRWDAPREPEQHDEPIAAPKAPAKKKRVPKDAHPPEDPFQPTDPKPVSGRGLKVSLEQFLDVPAAPRPSHE